MMVFPGYRVLLKVSQLIWLTFYFILGLKSFRTTQSILSGIEVVHIIKKTIFSGDKSLKKQVKFIHRLYGMAALEQISLGFYIPRNFCTRTIITTLLGIVKHKLRALVSIFSF
jgi:hypothetical protein